MEIITTVGKIVNCYERFDGRMAMTWWLIPSGGRERRCLGLTERMSPEDAVYAAAGVRPVSAL
jgi:hypothetical protein